MTLKHHIITLAAIVATFALAILLTPYLINKPLQKPFVIYLDSMNKADIEWCKADSNCMDILDVYDLPISRFKGHLQKNPLNYGIFEHKGQLIDCRDGYTTDLCCELWARKEGIK